MVMTDRTAETESLISAVEVAGKVRATEPRSDFQLWHWHWSPLLPTLTERADLHTAVSHSLLGESRLSVQSGRGSGRRVPMDRNLATSLSDSRRLCC